MYQMQKKAQMRRVFFEELPVRNEFGLHQGHKYFLLPTQFSQFALVLVVSSKKVKHDLTHKIAPIREKLINQANIS